MYIVSGARPLTSILTSVLSFLRSRSAWPVMTSGVFCVNDAKSPFSCLSAPFSAPAVDTAKAAEATATNVTTYLMCTPCPLIAGGAYASHAHHVPHDRRRHLLHQGSRP